MSRKRQSRYDNDYDYNNDEEYRPSGSVRRSKSSQNMTPTINLTMNQAQVNVETEMDASYTVDCSNLEMREDHDKKPLWVTIDRIIILEAFHQLYQKAYDFLVAVAEPISRPKHIHRYQLTEDSLYAAVAVGMNTEMIIEALIFLCKTVVPAEVISFIKNTTKTFGKAKLVLKDNKYLIESYDVNVLKELLRNPEISSARIKSVVDSNSDNFEEGLVSSEDFRNTMLAKIMIEGDDEEDDDAYYIEKGGMQPGRSLLNSVSFQIRADQVQRVKYSARMVSRFPLMEEYDFRNDPINSSLSIDLKGSTKIRSYQQKSLTKMFGNGRARSGIIVLPCGAGKTLTGVSAAATVKKSCIILCINNTSVQQWKDQILLWTNVDENAIRMFCSQRKDDLPKLEAGKRVPACILITTYSMLCHSKRSEKSESIVNQIKEREWGMMMLDEVHVAPARKFQETLSIVKAHCKLGLTATLVREDDKIPDLNFLVGPKLYEANWIDLTEQGYLAKVMCMEVWCPMTKEFYREYLEYSMEVPSSERIQRLLYAMNPRKFRTCEYLLKHHAARGDKVLIFSDDVPVLLMYCKNLNDGKGIDFIYGDTKESERQEKLRQFRSNPYYNVLGLSRVGDIALDLPEANVIIQVSSQYGSNRQEAQRLGRILRPKSNPTGEYNAFFYTLVSKNTREMYFANKRQEYLVNQGYTYNIREDIADQAEDSVDVKILRQHSKEKDLLNELKSINCDKWDKQEDKAIRELREGENDSDQEEDKFEVKKKTGNLSSLSSA